MLVPIKKEYNNETVKVASHEWVSIHIKDELKRVEYNNKTRNRIINFVAVASKFSLVQINLATNLGTKLMETYCHILFAVISSFCIYYKCNVTNF